MQLKEGIISGAGDLFYAFRFLKLLTTKWTDMKAYEEGVIDENGNVIVKANRTPAQKSSFTVFHRLVFNVKRLLEKLPFGKTKLASYAAALFLIKEHTGMSDMSIRRTLEKALGSEFDDDSMIAENTWFETDAGLSKGTYMLMSDIASPVTGEVIALKNSKVVVEQATKPSATMFGCNVYGVYHPKTNQKIYITNGDISR
jgi:hypothetical protein